MEKEAKVETTDNAVTAPPRENRLLDPEDNNINVSSKKQAKMYIFAAKIVLKKFGNVTLKGLGNATENCVNIAESLERYNYAKITRIYSETVQIDDTKDDSRKAAKFVVSLEKSAQFDKLTENMLK